MKDSPPDHAMGFAAMNQFKIEDSFVIEPNLFVFAGSILQGKASPGMTFEVPEAGHKWRVTIRFVEFIRTGNGSELLGLLVDNRKPGYLPGLGAGWTAELREQ
jgi:hypothetical protein